MKRNGRRVLHHRQVVYCVSAPPTRGPNTIPICETVPNTTISIILYCDSLPLKSPESLPESIIPKYTICNVLASAYPRIKTSIKNKRQIHTRSLCQRQTRRYYRQSPIHQPRSPKACDSTANDQHVARDGDAAEERAEFEDGEENEECVL